MIHLCGLAILATSCKAHKSGSNLFKSDCDINVTFKKVSFKQLVDSINNYDQQYVEVNGKYREGKELSALFNNSSFFDHADSDAIWVNFSQDCPLHLSGSGKGLFEVSNDRYTPINNKEIIIRGKIDLRNKGHLNRYKGTIDHVSLINY
jgi:hypothetical protein